MRDPDALRQVHPGVGGWWATLVEILDEAFSTTRRIWWYNPQDLVLFGPRLLRAIPDGGWLAALFSRRGARGQIPRTFVRGIGPVVLLGIAVGLGLGVVADRFGMILLPLVEQTFVLAMVRDGMPLILALLLTARTGASVAARLGDNRQTRFDQEHANSPELVGGVVPHLLAGAVTAWLFYWAAIVFLIAGYRSGGDPGDLLANVVAGGFFPLDQERELSQSGADGAAKAALFGFIIAYVSSALGISANERSYASERARAEALQDAVWESGLTSIVFCLVAAIIWWNVRGGME